MNARQRFKVAVLQKLIGDGFTLDEILLHVKSAADHLEKQAASPTLGGLAMSGLTSAGGALFGAGKTIGGHLGNLGVLGAVAGPPLLGAGAGALAAKMTDSGGVDPEEAKTLELIDRYRQLTGQAHINADLRRRKHGERPRFSRI